MSSGNGASTYNLHNGLPHTIALEMRFRIYVGALRGIGKLESHVLTAASALMFGGASC